MEVIKSWVFDPRNSFFKANKNDRAKVFYKMCSNKEKCSLYKDKKCVLLKSSGLFGYLQCIYGSTRESEGYTIRANNFYSWISEKEKENCGKEIKECGKGIFEVGEYYCFIFDYIDKLVLFTDVENSDLFKKYLAIKKEFFNIDIINKFINHKPRTLWGNDIIKDYEKKMIPLFIENIKYKFPKLYNEISEDIKNKYIISNVGREAYIKTMAIGSKLKDFHGYEYLWNGEKLICENYGLSFNFSKGTTRIESIPLDDELYKITDESQVNENTVYKD